MILIQPSINPIIVSLGFIDIRWYSLAYIFAFIFGSILIKKINKSSYNLLSDNEIDKFFIWAVIGVIVGGRIGYVLFYQTALFFAKPYYLIEIWNGGMSFHGGLIGIIFTMYFFSIKNNKRFFYLSDLVSLVAPIGLFFGRIARHPSQLYEAFFEGVVIITILFIYFKREPKNYSIGNISALFLIFYSIFRFLIEYLREPDHHLGLIFDYFSMGQLLCIPLFVAGLAIFFRK